LPRPQGYAHWYARIVSFGAFAIVLVCFPGNFLFSSVSTGKTNPQKDDALPQLVDITKSTGIKFDHLSSPEQKYIVESMSGGVALIDYDRDGWPDIYFTNAESVDMALSGKKARSALYHNNHDGTFTDVTDKAAVGYPCWATGAAFGDYDADGWVDLFVSHYVDFHLDDLPAFGSSKTCQYRGINVQCGPRGLKGSADNLYHNNGDGTFTDVSGKAGLRDLPNSFGLTVVWEDFDNDGSLDIFVANDGQKNFLLRNDGNGHFTEVSYSAGIAVSQDGAEQANMGVALGDYQHTGRASLAVTHFSDEYAALFRNDGGMNFSDVSFASRIAQSTVPYVGWGDTFFDLSNDGWLDLFLVNGHVYPQVDTIEGGARYREPKLLFSNQRNGTFKDVSKLAGPAIQLPQVSRGVAAGDLFNDGRIDIVVENLEGGPMILQPQGGPPNHWISFELEGTKSNRLALNARIRATSGDLVQTGEVLSGGSYLSQNDLRIHFGLGNSDRADKIEILWPSGKPEILTDVPADHFYFVKEDQGIVPVERSKRTLPKH
jgi:enediyne biosynthesis protein E4